MPQKEYAPIFDWFETETSIPVETKNSIEYNELKTLTTEKPVKTA